MKDIYLIQYCHAFGDKYVDLMYTDGIFYLESFISCVEDYYKILDSDEFFHFSEYMDYVRYLSEDIKELYLQMFDKMNSMKNPKPSDEWWKDLEMKQIILNEVIY